MSDILTGDEIHFNLEPFSDHFSRRCKALGMSEVMIRQALARGRTAVRKGWEFCDSPIERMLLPWLVFEEYGPHFMTCPAEVHVPKEMGDVPAADLFIVPQFAFARYRMDFALVARLCDAVRILCVECDGHAYHKATVENFIRDDARDDYLLGWGIETVRASGAEIHASPRAVSARVASIVMGWVQP